MGQPEPNVKILWTPPAGSNANNPYTFNIYAYEKLCSVNRRYMFRSAEFNAIPQPKFTVKIDTSLCSQLKFSATTIQTGTFKLDWLVYNNKDTIKRSSSAKDSINLPYPGKWYVKLKVQNAQYGCTNQYFDSIEPVNAAIVSNIGKQKTKVCKNTNLSFSSTTFNNQGTLNYQWFNNKQLVATTANYNTLITDTSKIKFIVSDKRNCKALDSITITTYPDKMVQHLPDTAICNKSSIAISALPTSPKDTITWLHNQQHTATQLLSVANSYVIQYTDSNQCFGRDTFLLREVVPFFINPMQDAQLCKNDTLVFQAQLQPVIAVDSLFWYKDGTRVSSAIQPKIVFSAPATMALKVFAKQYNKQCQANDTFNVSVYQKSDIGFNVLALDSCLPSNSFQVTKTGLAAANSLMLHWGDMQSQVLVNTATHHYSDTGIYTLTLYVTTANNCKDTAVKKVSVYAAPDAQFTIDDTVQCASDNKVTLNLNSPLLGANLHTVNWGDNIIVSQVPNRLYSHTYDKNSNTIQRYTISVSSSLSTNCTDTVNRMVSIYPNPVVKIKANGLCLGDTTLLSASILNALPIKTYAWLIENQASGNSPTTFTYFASIGAYKASVKVATDSLCEGFDTLELNILERPVAAFDFEKAQRDNLSNIPFYFTDRSTNANGWLWTINTSYQSKLQNLKYDFTDTGFARIKLVVSNQNTCYDSIERLLPIIERIKFYIPNVFTPNADGRNDGFGLHSSQYFLIKTFKMEVFNRWGEMVFKTTDMTEQWHPEKDQQSIYLVKILIKDLYNIDQEISGVVEVLR
ncbi:gliding motility-associated C-terminal domain-containing protein, partial [Methylotenera sp.]|uniref:T9SS type B sorting domain-containing protein n=1 Tax=Methylotenera sp. TaxID=2051956 RepID=UPI002488D9AA